MVLADIERLACLPFGKTVHDMIPGNSVRIGEKTAITRFADQWEVTIGVSETHSKIHHVWLFNDFWVHKHNGEAVDADLRDALSRVGPWRDVPNVGSKHVCGVRAFDLIGFDETNGSYIFSDGKAFRVVTEGAYQRDWSAVTAQSALDLLTGPDWAIDYLRGALK